MRKYLMSFVASLVLLTSLLSCGGGGGGESWNSHINWFVGNYGTTIKERFSNCGDQLRVEDGMMEVNLYDNGNRVETYFNYLLDKEGGRTNKGFYSVGEHYEESDECNYRIELHADMSGGPNPYTLDVNMTITRLSCKSSGASKCVSSYIGTARMYDDSAPI